MDEIDTPAAVDAIDAGPGEGDADDAIELPGWDQARDRVFLVVRPLGFFHALGATTVLAERSLPHLVESVAVDLGGAITYVTVETLEAWGIGAAELFDVARANVVERLDHQLEPVGDEEPARLYRCSSGDAFESSRLVSPVLAEMRAALEAEVLFVAAPDRDTLLVATDASPGTLIRLADRAEETFRSSEHPISPAIYILTAEDELGPLEMVDDHPLRERIRRGHLLLADAEYAAQKPVLEERLAALGIDAHVATHFAVARGEMSFSYATWSESGPALVPEVDLVVFAFVDEARPPLVVPWEAAVGLAGVLWEAVEGLDPPRRRTLGFPSEEMLAALADYAVEL